MPLACLAGVCNAPGKGKRARALPAEADYVGEWLDSANRICTIRGKELSFSNGDVVTTAFTAEGGLKINYEGADYTGILVNEELKWSDDDTWARLSSLGEAKDSLQGDWRNTKGEIFVIRDGYLVKDDGLRVPVLSCAGNFVFFCRGATLKAKLASGDLVFDDDVWTRVVEVRVARTPPQNDDVRGEDVENSASRSAAYAYTTPVSSRAAPPVGEPVDGSWQTNRGEICTIRNGLLIWPDGERMPVTQNGQRYSLQFEDDKISATLVNNTHLEWDDGDVWARCA